MGSSGDSKELQEERIKKRLLESMKNLPDDQYVCPQCTNVPEIISINYATFEITLDCPTHGRQTIPIDQYFKNESEYMYTNAVCDLDFRLQKENKDETFYYCEKCGEKKDKDKKDDDNEGPKTEGFILCEKCAKEHKHRKTLVELKTKNFKCRHKKDYIKYCKTCKKHLCQEDEQRHDKNHAIIDFLKPTEDEIKIIKNKKKYFEQKIDYCTYMIKFFDTLLTTYEEHSSNYFHNVNIINLINDIDNDEVLALRDKLKMYEKLLIKHFNDKFKVNLTGEELELNLTGKKIGNLGVEMLARINFTNLENLNLSRNEISNVQTIKNFKMPKIKKLDLSYNNIIDMFPLIEAIEKMPRLVNLKLNDNLLEDVSPIKEGGFANLQILF